MNPVHPITFWDDTAASKVHKLGPGQACATVDKGTVQPQKLSHYLPSSWFLPSRDCQKAGSFLQDLKLTSTPTDPSPSACCSALGNGKYNIVLQAFHHICSLNSPHHLLPNKTLLPEIKKKKRKETKTSTRKILKGWEHKKNFCFRNGRWIGVRIINNNKKTLPFS